MWYEDLTFAGVSNWAINIHVFFPKVIPIEHLKFWWQNTSILSSFVKYIVNNDITLYYSDCVIYIPPEKTKTVITVLKHYLYLNLTIQVTRDCVRRSFFIPSNWTLVRIGIEEIVST